MYMKKLHVLILHVHVQCTRTCIQYSIHFYSILHYIITYYTFLAFINKEQFLKELSYQKEDFYHLRAQCGSMELLH